MAAKNSKSGTAAPAARRSGQQQQQQQQPPGSMVPWSKTQQAALVKHMSKLGEYERGFNTERTAILGLLATSGITIPETVAA